MYLRSISYTKPEKDTSYPFCIPLLKALTTLELKAPVTILVGENGTGKSTLIEGIAAAAESITVGDLPIEDDTSMEAAKLLAERLKLVWRVRTRKGFFLRAEDFINYTKRITQLREELKNDLKEVEFAYRERSEHAKALASLPYQRSLYELKESYGEGLEFRSHGEGFLELFQSRFVPNGLYILDEPETPLSPTKQLAFIAMIKEMVEQNAQFIIATHSPILMAIPGASIISCDELPMKEVDYNDLEHVKLTRSFLNNPEQFLRYL